MPLYLFERVIILKGQMTSLSAVLIQNIMSNDIDLLKKSDLMLLKGLTFSDWRCLAVAEAKQVHSSHISVKSFN